MLLVILTCMIFVGPVRAADPICNQISVTTSPNQTTYLPGASVNVIVSGVTNATGTVTVYYSSTSANSQDSTVWHAIPVTFNPNTQNWQGLWSIPTASLQFNPNNNQEFFVAANYTTSAGLVCTGNPDPGPTYQSAVCANCKKIVVSYIPPANPLDLINYYKVTPGYSWTYTGQRLDDVIDDSGQTIHPAFQARWEVENPVNACSNRLLPIAMTKSNRWGYWQPAARGAAERATYWSGGQHNLRFLVTDPGGSYQWNQNFWGAILSKLYGLPAANSLQTMGILDKTVVEASLNNEPYYYAPYLLSPRFAQSGGAWSFQRSDSNFNASTEDPSVLCPPHPKTQDHSWSFRVQEVDDTRLLSEFQYWRNLYPGKKIVLWSYLEYPTGSSPNFREDWYLMDGVGFVGVDQKWGCLSCISSNSPLDSQYVTAKFMDKTDPTLRPDMTMRTTSVYLGGALNVKITPLAILTNGTYVFTATSGGANALPYDGYLEYQYTPTDFRPWSNIWLTNGMANVTPGVGPGYYQSLWRPKVLTNTSTNENQLAFTALPWSNPAGIWVLDATEMAKWDLDHTNTITVNDLRSRILQYNATNSDFNAYGFGQFTGKFCSNNQNCN